MQGTHHPNKGKPDMAPTKTAAAIVTVIQGVIIGTANVIPGVSGGTFAIILGVLERILNDVRSFNRQALDLLLKGRILELVRHTDLVWLAQLGAGMAVAIVSLARLLELLFDRYPTAVWAFFFGLIVVSVPFVGRTVSRWNAVTACFALLGAAAAVGTSYLSPAVENASPLYVFICGMVAISAMVLPGISGSFMLIIMGNYELIVINAINDLRLAILVPFGLGCGFGFLAFSYLLSWLLRRFRDMTISLLTGFIAGSLVVIWPWKNPVYRHDALGNVLIKRGEPVIFTYERYLPPLYAAETLVAVALAVAGGVALWYVERWAAARSISSDP